MAHKHKVFPWWLGFWLLNPLRNLRQNPEKTFAAFIKSGMKILEIGSGMGFFTLPLAKLAGENGKVVALDIQEKMLETLKQRAAKSGLASRIEARKISADTLALHNENGTFDCVFVFAVLHEMPDRKKALAEIYAALKNGGICIFAEPTGPVSGEEFEDSLKDAYSAGFKPGQSLELKGANGRVLLK